MNESKEQRTLIRPIMTAFITIAAAYVLVLVLMYLFQGSLVYHPSRDMIGDPSWYDLEYKDVNFEASDGTKLHGWFLPGKKDSHVVLFCHGNAGNISGRGEIMEMLSKLGLGVFIFDYRGYGNSHGQATEEGTYKDAKAAFDHMTGVLKIQENKIVLFGRSLGGGVALNLATKVNPAGLILMSTFTSLPDVGASAYPFLPVRLLSKYQYPNFENIKKVSCPLLIFHGKNDEMIPHKHGRSLFDAAKKPKRFVDLFGGHNDALLLSYELIQKEIAAFTNNL